MLRTLRKMNKKRMCNFSIQRQTSEAEMDVCFRLINFASQGNITALTKELEDGTNMNSSDYDLRTAFHIAASVGQEEVVKFFLEKKIP